MLHIPPLTITGTDHTAKISRHIYSDRDFENLYFNVEINEVFAATIQWYTQRWNVKIIQPTLPEEEKPYFTTDEIYICIDELQKHLARVDKLFYIRHGLPRDFSVDWDMERWVGVNRVI